MSQESLSQVEGATAIAEPDLFQDFVGQYPDDQEVVVHNRTMTMVQAKEMAVQCMGHASAEKMIGMFAVGLAAKNALKEDHQQYIPQEQPKAFKKPVAMPDLTNLPDFKGMTRLPAPTAPPEMKDVVVVEVTLPELVEAIVVEDVALDDVAVTMITPDVTAIVESRTTQLPDILQLQASKLQQDQLHNEVVTIDRAPIKVAVAQFNSQPKQTEPAAPATKKVPLVNTDFYVEDHDQDAVLQLDVAAPLLVTSDTVKFDALQDHAFPDEVVHPPADEDEPVIKLIDTAEENYQFTVVDEMLTTEYFEEPDETLIFHEAPAVTYDVVSKTLIPSLLTLTTVESITSEPESSTNVVAAQLLESIEQIDITADETLAPLVKRLGVQLEIAALQLSYEADDRMAESIEELETLITELVAYLGIEVNEHDVRLIVQTLVAYKVDQQITQAGAVDTGMREAWQQNQVMPSLWSNPQGSLESLLGMLALAPRQLLSR